MKIQEARHGTSLAVQWLGLCLSTAGAQVQSLVKELTSHMQHCATKTKVKNNQRQKKRPTQTG